MKFTGTSTAPMRANAKRSATKLLELRDRMATLSPGSTPRASNALATRLQILSSSR